MSTITIPRPNGLGGFAGLIARLPRWLLPAAGLLLAGLLVWAVLHSRSHVQAITSPVVTQTLVQSVTASGTVNPQNLVTVGTQVSGTIASIDVDYNSKVKQGQVLARLDTSTLQAQLDQARAGLVQAQAAVAQAAGSAGSASAGIGVASANDAADTAAVASAKASVAKTQAALALAQKTAARDGALLAQGYVAQSAVDADRSSVAQDQGDIAVAQAAVAQTQAQAAAGAATVNEQASTASSQVAGVQAAQANVAAAQAVVRQDELNLEHAVITSPVDGTVVARDVSVGQTVAASLQTPTLFSIAQNLGKMEVDINVGEPDIGGVRAGDAVAFSVLAYPNQLFRGTVAQVRINPQTLNNVVTYDVVVYAANAGGQLLPGMTANATIAIASAQNALTVPVSALHTTATSSATPWGNASDTGTSNVSAGSAATLIVERDGRATPIHVRVTLSNGTLAAVQPVENDTLATNDRVVTGWATPKRSARTASSSPMNASPVGGGMRGIH
ncbi:MAG TPA: efflux RND transporter periplasmic adaptor subunit [Candidatus Cybelea sp.]|nr:efflux RND transporter periplasmic adaptor subunit [Candidatus Cybelea sp.]